MIAEFSLRPLHNGEHISFIDGLLRIVPGQDLPDPLLAVRSELETLHQAIKAVHVSEDDSELSQAIRAEDARRDELWSGLSQLAGAYEICPVAEKARAGRLLAERMADYGSVRAVTAQGDADESADINGLLRDLQNAPLAAAAALIGANDWINALRTTQFRFEELSGQRTAERSERSTNLPDNIETLRPRVARAFRNLCRKINSYLETSEGAAPWPELVANVNALINEQRQKIAARKGRAAASANAVEASRQN